MLVFNVHAQKIKKTAEKETVNLLQGLTLQVDVAPIANLLLSSGETYSYEAAAQLDLKHQYYPILELGYAGANKTSNDAINFKSNSFFSRIGVDINLLSSKKDEEPTTNLFLAGLRLGICNFDYNISNVKIIDSYWNTSSTFNYPTKNTTRFWYEIVSGVRVEISKNIFMGWTVRIKNPISQDITSDVNPWYIPGFGQNSSTTNWGFNYTIGYKLNFDSKIKPNIKSTTKPTSTTHIASEKTITKIK